jgi:very-short-patch-repair endonuclease
MQRFPKPQVSSTRKALLAHRAAQHRSALNSPEEVLWRALSRGQLGVWFRRQVVLGDHYIVDFFAASVGLVVEVDGRCHEKRRRADARRDERLRRLGYRVVRVEARVVLSECTAAVEVVRGALDHVRVP